MAGTVAFLFVAATAAPTLCLTASAIELTERDCFGHVQMRFKIDASCAQFGLALLRTDHQGEPIITLIVVQVATRLARLGKSS